MKKKSITISELDVQPISDEDLLAITGLAAGAAAALSDVCECRDGSDTVICYSDQDQDR